ncbi:MAG: aspartate aminotransferase family protein, partial [Ilumatobacteraceae bacterium]
MHGEPGLDFVKRQQHAVLAGELADACEVLAGGATSNWMISRPAAVWVSHGRGSRVWDVDDTEYVDLHGGYGVMVAG